jgi:TolA-binding protein
VDEVNQEVNRLRGEIEVSRRELEQVKTTLHDYQLSQESRQLRDEARLAQLEKFLGLTPPAALDEQSLTGLADETTPSDDVTGSDTSGAETESGAQGTQAEAGAQEIGPEAAPVVYQTKEERIALAKSHMDEGRYPVSRAILLKAIETNPKAEEVPEMRYLVAQSYLHEENWRAAATELKSVLEVHSKSEWAPWSMLRLGECFDGLGKRDSAVLFYEGVLQSYPRSEASKEAKRRLK